MRRRIRAFRMLYHFMFGTCENCRWGHEWIIAIDPKATWFDRLRGMYWHWGFAVRHTK